VPHEVPMRFHRFLPALAVLFLVVLVSGSQRNLAADDKAKAAPWTIPFELNSNKIYVRVALDGKDTSYWFILDTGCPATAVDLDLARRLQWPVVDLRPVGGAGTGMSEISLTKIADVRVGEVTFRPEPIWALKAHPIVSPYEGRAIDGVIGGDFFARHVIE